MVGDKGSCKGKMRRWAIILALAMPRGGNRKVRDRASNNGAVVQDRSHQ